MASALPPFPSPWLLAPMEGVTDPVFRRLVAERNQGRLGAVFTEFARVTDHPWTTARLRAHVGRPLPGVPVGLQLMGSDLAAMGETARRAAEVAAMVDINFGCPARGALRGCAGSALLRDPRLVEETVGAVVRAVGGRAPVTAKIRAGLDDASRVEELARAVEAGGASMLTVHCRTRAEGYRPAVDWSRIARAVAAVRIPVCGNGGVLGSADLRRMRLETGCAFCMVGHGALRDPWIFSGRRVSRGEAARFLADYADRMAEESGVRVPGQAARLKQLFHHFRAGGLLDDDAARRLLREPPNRVLEWVRSRREVRSRAGAGGAS